MNLNFDVLIRDNAEIDIESLCKQDDYSHPTLKGRIGGENGAIVTLYLIKMLQTGDILVVTENYFNFIKVSDIHCGDFFGSTEDVNSFCLKTRICFNGRDRLFEIFLNRKELEIVLKVKKFLVPVVYQVWGLVEIEALSVEEARKKLADPNFVDKMGLPEEPSYLDDSYVIDKEGEIKNIDTGETFPVSEE